METSILKSTKQILGLSDETDEFDLDIVTHINTAFSNLYQLGVGDACVVIDDDGDAEWDSLDVPPEQLSQVKTYIFLKVQMYWDTPGTSFLISAREKQIEELEWRLNAMREVALDVN